MCEYSKGRVLYNPVLFCQQYFEIMLKFTKLHRFWHFKDKVRPNLENCPFNIDLIFRLQPQIQL